jgi:nitrate reductase gamma subunit
MEQFTPRILVFSTENVSAADWAFSFHLVVVFNFLVSLPFTKFEHVVYRPLALWLAGMKSPAS